VRINWDQFPDDFDVDAVAAPQAREPLSEGIHSGKIENVSVQQGWRVTDDNPSGDCLSIWLDCQEGGHRKRVFVTVPITNIQRIAVIAKACGVEPPKRGQSDWDETVLHGRTATVETSRYQVANGPKAGEWRASVKRWVLPDAKPARPAATRQPPPKAPPPIKLNRNASKGAQADEIPF
jgi:hypothetical protein